jgi:hypothetical protein
MKKTILFAAALVLVLVFAAVSRTASGPKHHIVFQLTEPERPDWGSTAFANAMRPMNIKAKDLFPFTARSIPASLNSLVNKKCTGRIFN